MTLSQVWTWNDFSFVNDPRFGNNRLAGAPPHVLRTILGYLRPDGFYVAPSLDWVPAGSLADFANTVRTPGYLLLGVQARLTLPQGFSLFVDARNLTGQRYISNLQTVINASVPANQEIYFPGEGRAVYAGMRFTF